MRLTKTNFSSLFLVLFLFGVRWVRCVSAHQSIQTNGLATGATDAIRDMYPMNDTNFLNGSMAWREGSSSMLSFAALGFRFCELHCNSIPKQTELATTPLDDSRAFLALLPAQVEAQSSPEQKHNSEESQSLLTRSCRDEYRIVHVNLHSELPKVAPVTGQISMQMRNAPLKSTTKNSKFQGMTTRFTWFHVKAAVSPVAIQPCPTFAGEALFRTATCARLCHSVIWQQQTELYSIGLS